MSYIDHILTAKDLPVTKLRIDEWDTDIYLRSWRGDERAALEKRHFSKGQKIPDPSMFRHDLLKTSLCTEDGDLVLDDDQASLLMKKNASVIERIVERILEINGMAEGTAKNGRPSQ